MDPDPDLQPRGACALQVSGARATGLGGAGTALGAAAQAAHDSWVTAHLAACLPLAPFSRSAPAFAAAALAAFIWASDALTLRWVN